MENEKKKLVLSSTFGVDS